MAGISDEQKKVMQEKASGVGFDYASLGEYLQSQLADAQASQEAFKQYQPTAKANVEAIGSFEGRAPGESPVDIRAQGLTTAQAISSTASRTQGNILDVLTSMMNLKKQEEAERQRAEDSKMAYAQLELEANKAGMTLDKETLQPRPLTDAEKKEKQLDGLDATTASYLELFQNGSMKKITEIPAEDRSAVVRALADKGINLEQISLEREASGVGGVIKTLYDHYTAGAGAEDDLSKGRFGGVVTHVKAAVGKDARAKKYNDAKEGVLATIRSFVGESGIMTEDDAKRIKKLLPSVTDTPEEAAIAWNDINNFFKGKYGVDIIPQEMTTTKEPGGMVIMSGPDGTVTVPAENVPIFEENGYRRQ